MIIRFIRKLFLRRGQLTYPNHYKQTWSKEPGIQQSLKLVDAESNAAMVALTFHWTADLSDKDADFLDSRLRAFVACGIYDAALRGGLDCIPGMPHGIRPAWIIDGGRIPVSVISAGFDVAEKNCYVQIGPVVMIVAGNPAFQRIASQLCVGFEKQFPGITV